MFFCLVVKVVQNAHEQIFFALLRPDYYSRPMSGAVWALDNLVPQICTTFCSPRNTYNSHPHSSLSPLCLSLAKVSFRSLRASKMNNIHDYVWLIIIFITYLPSCIATVKRKIDPGLIPLPNQLSAKESEVTVENISVHKARRGGGCKSGRRHLVKRIFR